MGLGSRDHVSLTRYLFIDDTSSTPLFFHIPITYSIRISFISLQSYALAIAAFQTETMPFAFAYVCDLLDQLEKLVNRSPPLLRKDLQERANAKTIEWLKRHRSRLNAQNVDDKAVMEIFWPQRRTGRHYGLDAQNLEQIIARLLNLPKKHTETLQEWRHEGARIKLPECVEKVLDSVRVYWLPIGVILGLLTCFYRWIFQRKEWLHRLV